jgi:hypothetical protein
MRGSVNHWLDRDEGNVFWNALANRIYFHRHATYTHSYCMVDAIVIGLSESQLKLGHP